MNQAENDKVYLENETHSDYYSHPKLRWYKFVVLGVIFFVVSFLLHFPLQKTAQDFAEEQLSSIPGCPIQYDSFSLSLLMPKVKLKNASVPGRCIQQPIQNLNFDDLTVNVLGPSFSPIGVKSRINAKLKSTQVILDQVISQDKILLTGDQTKINLADILKIIEIPINLAGNLKMTFDDVLISHNSPESGSLKAQSKDLVLYPSTIMNFNIPSKLNIKNFLMKINIINSSKIKVDKFILGDVNSPIRASLEGLIRLNSKNAQSSPIDLRLQVSFSEAFLSMSGMSMIGMLMDRFNKKDGFYQIKVGGTLGNPIPSKL